MSAIISLPSCQISGQKSMVRSRPVLSMGCRMGRWHVACTEVEGSHPFIRLYGSATWSILGTRASFNAEEWVIYSPFPPSFLSLHSFNLLWNYCRFPSCLDFGFCRELSSSLRVCGCLGVVLLTASYFVEAAFELLSSWIGMFLIPRVLWLSIIVMVVIPTSIWFDQIDCPFTTCINSLFT